MSKVVYFYCADIYFEGKVLHRTSGAITGFDRVESEEHYNEIKKEVESVLLEEHKPSDKVLITSLNLI